MAQAVRVYKTGGPEVLKLENIGIPQPGMSEVLVKQTYIGVNFIDIYHRTGLYKLPTYPSGIGQEAAGVVERVGEWVTNVKPGDRVAYCGGPVGAYAEYRVIPAKNLVKLPDTISDEIAAAVMLKGMTAQYLLRVTFRVQKGDVILFHAAAGGVGLLACQWAKYLGATVIGTVGTEEKAKLAKENGCDHVILYTQQNVVKRVKDITAGQGVDVVYDSIGKDTFTDSLDCLKKFGMMVSFGNASGAIPPFDPLILSQKGSLYFTRPSLMHHIEDPEAYAGHAVELFDLIGKGVLKVKIDGEYRLTDVKKAHIALESRKTTGSLVLKV